jgi:hypothetical protein
VTLFQKLALPHEQVSFNFQLNASNMRAIGYNELFLIQYQLVDDYEQEERGARCQNSDS